MPTKGSPPQGGGELWVSAEKLGLESTFVPEDHCNSAHLDIKALFYEHRRVLMSYYSL